MWRVSCPKEHTKSCQKVKQKIKPTATESRPEFLGPTHMPAAQGPQETSPARAAAGPRNRGLGSGTTELLRTESVLQGDAEEISLLGQLPYCY